MRIKEAAQKTGLSISNIRFYEKKELLVPARDMENKYRDYTEEDIERLKMIMVYRKMDLPVETIYALFHDDISLDEVLRNQEEELEQQILRLEGAIDLCRKMQNESEQKTIDPDHYLNYVREEEEHGKKFGEMADFAEDLGNYTESVFMLGGLSGLMNAAGKYGWLVKACYLLVWTAMLGFVLYSLITGSFSIPVVILIDLCFLYLIIGFFRYRNEKG